MEDFAPISHNIFVLTPVSDMAIKPNEGLPNDPLGSHYPQINLTLALIPRSSTRKPSQPESGSPRPTTHRPSRSIARTAANRAATSVRG